MALAQGQNTAMILGYTNQGKAKRGEKGAYQYDWHHIGRKYQASISILWPFTKNKNVYFTKNNNNVVIITKIFDIHLYQPCK